MDTQVPENLAELDDADALAALKAELDAEFDAKYEAGEDIATLTQIADAVDAVVAQQDANKAAAEADEADRAALRSRMDATATSEDITDTDEQDEASAESEAPVEDDTTTPVESSDDDVTTAEQEKELVTAAAPPSAAATKRSAPTPTAAPTSAHDVVITASADVPGLASGQQIDKGALVAAMHSRSRGLIDDGKRIPVAQIEDPRAQEFRIEKGDDADAVMTAAVASRLDGADAKALLASGGWCTPSDNMFEQFSVESRDGLLDIAEVGVTRGGTNVPSFFGIADAANALWSWDETKDNNTPTDSKPCLAVPCPTWTDVRLEAEGLCLTHGNLMDRAYPEMTTRFMDLTVTAHLHRLSNARVAKIVASATAVDATAASDSDAAGDVLGQIDVQVADYRSQHLAGRNAVMDAIMPEWFIELIRVTLAKRNGVEAWNVSDDEINNYFTTRNIRPQFLSGYEALYDSSPKTSFPTSGKFLLMYAGAYVGGNGGAIDLGVVRDSTLNETNDFTLAWSEQFYSVMQRGPAAREVTVATVANGQTGGPQFVGA